MRRITEIDLDDLLHVSEKQTAEALRIQADNIRNRQNLDVEGAKEGFERQQEVAGTKKQLKQEKIVASGEDFIAKALKMAKPLKVVVPPLAVAAGVLAAKDTYASTRDQLTDLGLPKPLAQAGGALAGATEFLPVAPSDVVSVARSIPEQPSMMQSMQARGQQVQDIGDEFGNLDQQGQPTPSAPVNIPDPVPTRQGMLAAGGAKQRVNQARSAALAGQETSMSGSFLN